MILGKGFRFSSKRDPVEGRSGRARPAKLVGVHGGRSAVRYNGDWLVLDNRTLDIRRDVDIAQLFDPLFIVDRHSPHPADMKCEYSTA